MCNKFIAVGVLIMTTLYIYFLLNIILIFRSLRFLNEFNSLYISYEIKEITYKITVRLSVYVF